MERMNRDQFYAAMAGLDEARLRKVLWTLYWRSAATVRARFESELAPDQAKPRSREPDPVDPRRVLREVREFVALARSGAYMAGDRRVSPKERTRWRFTLRRLVADARAALLADDLDPGVAAVTAIVDLACLARECDYFHSDDPVEAAGLVVSDEIAVMWRRMLECVDVPRIKATGGVLVRTSIHQIRTKGATATIKPGHSLAATATTNTLRPP
jgi:hypothetical protein